jgi:glutamate carboxypeptidase
MKKFFITIACYCFVFTSHAQELTATEQKLLKEIEDAMPATLQLLKESVNINSGTFNTTGVRKTGDVYAKELSALGFAVEWVNLPDSMRRGGHMVATRKGKKGKRVLLIGHLDTVFEPDMPPNPYTLLNDSTATGQGVVDMKGGNVLVIAALKAMNRLGLLNDVTITVYFTGDEENVGEPRTLSRADMIRRSQQHDVCLSFESAQGLNNVTTARRGSSEWKLEVEAPQRHSAGIFGAAGFGSIYEAARIVNEIREKLSNEKYMTINPALFLGGSNISYDSVAQKGTVSVKTNIISPKTIVTGDLRFLTEEQKNRARDTMRQVVNRHLPSTNARINFADQIPSMPPTEGNQKLEQLTNQVNLALGYGPVKAGDPATRGAGDISYVAHYLDCLDGIGASGSGAHAPGETINLKEYPKLIKRASILIYRLIK